MEYSISATYEKGQKEISAESYFVHSFICYSKQGKQETTEMYWLFIGMEECL